MSCEIDFKTLDRKKDEILKDYHNRAYLVFKDDLIKQEIKFNGIPVKVREIPIEDNKVQGFFHVISEQDKRSKIIERRKSKIYSVYF